MTKTKRFLMTLVALLAVTTGAWAEETPIATILASENSTFVSGSKTFADKVKITFSGAVDWLNNRWQVVYDSTNGNEGTVTVEGVNGTNISKVVFYDNYGSHVMTTSPYTLYFYQAPEESSFKVCTGANGEGETDINMITKIEVFGAAASSGPEVAWDKAAKTGTFKMPGGNVTLQPEYYPQAALATQPTAINDVPATTDGAIVSAGTVATIGETTNAQGTVMYYVSTTALDDAALQALAADQWTADVPTAADLTEGQAYVYYYVRGNDSETDDENFSDGDILAANALTVTIAAEPTYAVTFAEGTEESDKWTASPAADVKKGETVTVSYSGTKKVIGVKAEKKAKGNSVDLSTLTEAYEAQTLDILTGTTNQPITIAAGATVTLKDVTVNNQITCLGDATIILADGSTNTVTASENAGIQIGGTGTLTINAETAGTGRLNATGGNQAAGIGTSMNGTGGNIVINGGTVNATGGFGGAGIGAGYGIGTTSSNECGAITINGGTVNATGGFGGAGIGTGYADGSTNKCGTITIGTGVTSVTATMGGFASYSIGIGGNNTGTQTCGTITIGGVVKAQSDFTDATYTYPTSN